CCQGRPCTVHSTGRVLCSGAGVESRASPDQRSMMRHGPLKRVDRVNRSWSDLTAASSSSTETIPGIPTFTLPTPIALLPEPDAGSLRQRLARGREVRDSRTCQETSDRRRSPRVIVAESPGAHDAFEQLV